MAQSDQITVVNYRARPNRLLKELVDIFDTSTGHTHDGSDSAAVAAATASLDLAYDYTGAGAGKAITVDSGPIALTNNAANNLGILAITKSPVGAQSGVAVLVTVGALSTGAALQIANTGSGNDITGAAWSVTVAGVATFDSLAVGVIKFTADVLGTGSAMIGNDNAGDVTINALTGKQVHLAVNDVDVVNVSNTTMAVVGAITSTTSVTVGNTFTVTLGGAAITGNSTVTGDLEVTGGLTVGGAYTFSVQITASAGIDMNGTELILDVDADTSITASTDDQIDFRVSGTDVVTITATVVDINGLKLDLDADANTSITADTDDTIDIEIAGADDFQFTANTFSILSGSALNIDSGATLAATGIITIVDDTLFGLGTGNVARLSYDTTDANANELLLQLPAGGATDVPVLAIGQSIESVDLGLFNGVVDPTIAVFGVGAVTTSPRLRVYKARGTIASPTVVTTGDDLFSIDAYGAVAAGEYVQAARILFEMAGTIATTRGPGTITFQTATDAAPSVLTTALTISAAQLVTAAAGVTVTTGNVTVSSGNLAFTAASDVLIAAATAAALEISDATTKFYAIDTRVATSAVITHAFDISDYTVASGATVVVTAMSLAAHTLNYTGATQVTTQVDTVVIGARTIASDTATLTVNEANTMLLVAPTESTNVIITAASALRIVNAGGTPLTQYGIYIEDLTVGATADVGIYIAGADTAAIYVAADPIHVADSVVIGFGTGTGVGAYDASITYNATNLVINPKVIGAGVLNVAGSVTVLGGQVIQADAATEIGISVTNAALVVGTAGTLVAPYLHTTAAAFSDAIGGDADGAIGINSDSDAGPIITLEARSQGAWVSVALAGTLIPAKRAYTPSSKTRNYMVHKGQIFEEDGRSWVDETVCLICGEKMAVGDEVSMYANSLRANGDLHAIYGHSHSERDEYIRKLEARIAVLEKA